MTERPDEAGLNALLAYLIHGNGGTISIDSASYDAWARAHGAFEGPVPIVYGRIEEADEGRLIVLTTRDEEVSP